MNKDKQQAIFYILTTKIGLTDKEAYKMLQHKEIQDAYEKAISDAAELIELYFEMNCFKWLKEELKKKGIE